MTSLTIKLPEEMKARLEVEARQSGKSVSALIRESVTEYLAAGQATSNLLERTQDLCGAGSSGIPDLATNPAHIAGFGE